MEYRTRKRERGTNRRARQLRRGDNFAEALVWNALKNRSLGGHKFVRQFPLGPYFADFCCRECRLVVELDGSQHAFSADDRRRDEFMRAQGYSIIRVWSADVARNLRAMCDTILAGLDGRLEDTAASDLRYVSARRKDNQR